MNFEVVDKRPEPSRGRKTELNDALIETVKSGKAIRIELNGRSYNSVQNGVHLCASRKGLRGHVRRDGDTHVIAWLDEKPIDRT